ncbi:hypothetical protein ABZ839_33285 [Streptomyces cellulosae]
MIRQAAYFPDRSKLAGREVHDQVVAGLRRAVGGDVCQQVPEHVVHVGVFLLVTVLCEVLELVHRPSAWWTWTFDSFQNTPFPTGSQSVTNSTQAPCRRSSD